MVYITDYQTIFKNKTKKFFDKAQQNTQWLLVSQLRNIIQISNTITMSDYFQLQHFITVYNRDVRVAIYITALVVIRINRTTFDEEIKYLFTSAEIEQFTEKAITCMQA